MADRPIVAGALADHPLAAELAAEVLHVHRRYATEVVAAFALCPYINDVAGALGRFCVMLDHEPEIEAAAEQAILERGVTHLVYPLCRVTVTELERFGSRLHERARRDAARLGRANLPVHATFHPEMAGSREDSHRFVGLLRRAPDPFVQMVPEGLADGGTVFADPTSVDISAVLAAGLPRKDRLFARLTSADFDRIEELQHDIRADRDRRYARFLDALG